MLAPVTLPSSAADMLGSTIIGFTGTDCCGSLSELSSPESLEWSSESSLDPAAPSCTIGAAAAAFDSTSSLSLPLEP
jgi:hypothetical protein